MQKGILENWENALKEILRTIELVFELAQRPCAELALVISMLKDYYEVADAIFDYEPVSPSDIEKQRSMYYLRFQQMLSLQ